jgi:anti-sigma B factor antagonist
MNIRRQNGTLNVNEVRELSAASARSFRREICAAMAPGLKTIEIDLSQTSFVDSCGLGALISLYKAAQIQNVGVAVRLLNPRPPVQQVFELTRMHQLFEIVPHREPAPNGSDKLAIPA